MKALARLATVALATQFGYYDAVRRRRLGGGEPPLLQNVKDDDAFLDCDVGGCGVVRTLSVEPTTGHAVTNPLELLKTIRAAREWTSSIPSNVRSLRLATTPPPAATIPCRRRRRGGDHDHESVAVPAVAVTKKANGPNPGAGSALNGLRASVLQLQDVNYRKRLRQETRSSNINDGRLGDETSNEHPE